MIWPAKPSYSNPIVAVVGFEVLEIFNFTLLNGEITDLLRFVDGSEKKFEPDAVSEAVLWW